MDSSRGSVSLQNLGKTVIEDPLSPFFLHHSDNPGIALFSNRLTGGNYARGVVQSQLPCL